MLNGSYNHSMDAKGRVAVPAQFRDELGTSFFVRQEQEKCLALYSKSEWNAFYEKIEKLPQITNPEVRKLQRFFLGLAKEVQADAQGRVLIAPELRKYAGLKKEIVMIGVGNHVEIWDKATWEQECASVDPSDFAFTLSEFNL